MYVIGGALIIGLTLGLLGSGGSILTVPVLVYLLGHSGKAAIAESLAIVGGIALVASIPYARARLVDWHSVIYFGLPGMLGTYLGAWAAKFVPDAGQLVLFAVVMLVAAWMMFRPQPMKDRQGSKSITTNRAGWRIGIEGLIVGIVTGLVGVGGGFLIVPALVVLGGLPMRFAVGTSLAIIAMKSLTGFYKYLDVLDSLQISVDWSIVTMFVIVGVTGSFVGSALTVRVSQTRLQRAFAGFLLVMGAAVLAKEAPVVLSDLGVRTQASVLDESS